MEMKTFLRTNWDRALAAALVIGGVLMLIVGWFGVSGTGLVAEQNPYLISAGLGGVAVIVLGCTVWMSADLQDEWRRLDGIEERLAALATPTPSPASRSDASTRLANGASRRRARSPETAGAEADPSR